MKISSILITIFIVAALFTLVLNPSNSVFAYHFGNIAVYSDVSVGGGNSSTPINRFDPIGREIYAGETVKWSNPTAGKPYPHIVVFTGNQSTELNAKLSNITETLRTSNAESIISDLNKLIGQDDNPKVESNQTFNMKSILFPSVINSSNLLVTYLNASGNSIYKGAQYNVTGNETFLSSGLIWAGGFVPDGFAKIYSFSGTFPKVGTYHYQCLLYPEMKGSIIVKPNPGRLGINLTDFKL